MRCLLSSTAHVFERIISREVCEHTGYCADLPLIDADLRENPSVLCEDVIVIAHESTKSCKLFFPKKQSQGIRSVFAVSCRLAFGLYLSACYSYFFWPYPVQTEG